MNAMPPVQVDPARCARHVLFTNKGLDKIPLHRWFDTQRDDIAIVAPSELVPEFRRSFAEVHGVDDYFDDEQFDAVADAALTGRARPVHTLCYLIEADVERCGRLRDRHGIPGMSYADSLLFRNKWLMKQRVSCRVRTPRFCRVANRSELARFADEVGFPLVLKPLDRFASMSVRVLHHAGELVEIHQPMLAEEYVEGSMVHVDGFMRDARLLTGTVSRYKNGCLAFNQGLALGSIQLDEDSPEHRRVMAFAEAVIHALPPTGTCMFHLEVFVRPDGELLFCEIAARMGGGHIYDVLNATYGTDVVKLWLAAQMGHEWPAPLQPATPHRHGFLLVPPVEGTLKDVRPIDLPPCVMRSCWPQASHKDFTRATSSIETVASFVVQGRDAAEVAAWLDHCEDLARRALVWQTPELMELEDA